MLKRNLSVKNAPQRWQDNSADGCFDIVMTFEERVFDLVMEGFSLLFSLYVLFFLSLPCIFKHLLHIDIGGFLGFKIDILDRTLNFLVCTNQLCPDLFYRYHVP